MLVLGLKERIVSWFDLGGFGRQFGRWEKFIGWIKSDFGQDVSVAEIFCGCGFKIHQGICQSGYY